MKTNIHNINEKKCWSCQYYHGVRAYKVGLFLGDYFEVDEKAFCSLRCTNNKDGNTLYSWDCSKYQKASDVSAIIESKKAEAEYRRKLKELKIRETTESHNLESRPNLQKANEAERKENERWNNLTYEQQINEIKNLPDSLKKQGKIKIEKSLKTKIERVKENRSSSIAWIIIIGIASFVGFILGWIPYGEKAGKANMEKIIGNQQRAEDFMNAANSLIFLPFLILGIGMVIIAVIVFIYKKRNPKIKKQIEYYQRLLKQSEEI